MVASIQSRISARCDVTAVRCDIASDPPHRGSAHLLPSVLLDLHPPEHVPELRDKCECFLWIQRMLGLFAWHFFIDRWAILGGTTPAECFHVIQSSLFSSNSGLAVNQEVEPYLHVIFVEEGRVGEDWGSSRGRGNTHRGRLGASIEILCICIACSKIDRDVTSVR